MRHPDWIRHTLSRRQDWSEGLATFHLEGEVPEFKSGQFLRVGLDIGEDKPLSRPYSVASAPDGHLEFFIVLVEGGALTTPLFELAEGDEVLVHPRAGGVFTLDWVPDAEAIWLVATGTGLAPYISMLRGAEVWEKFDKVVLVQGVRKAEQLCYLEELDAISEAKDGRLRQVNFTSREASPHALEGRVTSAVEDGSLEEAAGVRLGPETSQVLLCGNPAMVKEMQSLLGARGMERNRRRSPGHVTVEKYW
ncbi:MAG: ferredoxin--NADP reductase [Alphaproteobacteria bacterium]|nr:ferredoxin--NADP reductase [Alphaproteobacteria bacterium]